MSEFYAVSFHGRWMINRLSFAVSARKGSLSDFCFDVFYGVSIER